MRFVLFSILFVLGISLMGCGDKNKVEVPTNPSGKLPQPQDFQDPGLGGGQPKKN